MRWDRRSFGREYDLDIFMIVAFRLNMGAMEKRGQTSSTTSSCSPVRQSATDARYASIEAGHAPEYFHNWTETGITCRDWFSFALKEG